MKNKKGGISTTVYEKTRLSDQSTDREAKNKDPIHAPSQVIEQQTSKSNSNETILLNNLNDDFCFKL